MPKYRTPRFEPHVDRTAEQAAKEYDEVAEFNERIARDSLAFNVARRSEGKAPVAAVATTARRYKARAKAARDRAARLRARARSA
jgi:hypothetical protein